MPTSTGHVSRQVEYHFKPAVAILRDQIEELAERTAHRLIQLDYPDAQPRTVITRAVYNKRRVRVSYHSVTRDDLYIWRLSDGYFLTNLGSIGRQRLSFSDAEGNALYHKPHKGSITPISGWMVVDVDRIAALDFPKLFEALQALFTKL